MQKSSIGIIFVLLIFLLTSQLFGQRQRMNPEEQLDRLKTSLNLSDEQTAKIKVILSSSQNEAKTLRQMNEGNFSGMRQGMMELRQRTNVQIEQVLDEEQKVIFRDLQQNRRKSRKRGEGRQLEDLKGRLSLTEEQVAELMPILKASRLEIEEIKANREGGRRKMMRKIEKVREETDEKITALLTDEQVEKYQRYKKDRQKRQRRSGGRNW